MADEKHLKLKKEIKRKEHLNALPTILTRSKEKIYSISKEIFESIQKGASTCQLIGKTDA